MIARDRLSAEQIFHDRQAQARALSFAGDEALRFDDDGYLDHETWIRPAMERLGDVAALPVLDYGCGHGMAAVVLARRGASVTAFDLSHGYLTEARRRRGQRCPYQVSASRRRASAVRRRQLCPRLGQCHPASSRHASGRPRIVSRAKTRRNRRLLRAVGRKSLAGMGAAAICRIAARNARQTSNRCAGMISTFCARSSRHCESRAFNCCRWPGASCHLDASYQGWNGATGACCVWPRCRNSVAMWFSPCGVPKHFRPSRARSAAE